MDAEDINLKYKEKETKKKVKNFRINKTGIIIGVLFVLVGIVWILNALSLIPPLLLKVWPQLVLIVIGLFIVFESLN